MTTLKSQIARQVRNRCDAYLCVESSKAASDAAIYTLSDPRDVRVIRYVGQTASPRRRYLQHVGASTLWLPDDLPWWLRKPRERPLHQWIRDLYRDECRLPFMTVIAWSDAEHALAEEQRHIRDFLACGHPLLNHECELAARAPRPKRSRRSGKAARRAP